MEEIFSLTHDGLLSIFWPRDCVCYLYSDCEFVSAVAPICEELEVPVFGRKAATPSDFLGNFARAYA